MQAKIAFVRRAKSHAVKCSKKKKKSRKKKTKTIRCTAEECEVVVKSKKDLKRHFKNDHPALHTQYSCSICAKTFKDLGNYKRHIMLHKNLLTRDCLFCGKTLQKYNMNQHIKRWHGPKVIANAIIHDVFDSVFAHSTLAQSEGGVTEVFHNSDGEEVTVITVDVLANVVHLQPGDVGWVGLDGDNCEPVAKIIRVGPGDEGYIDLYGEEVMDVSGGNEEAAVPSNIEILPSVPKVEKSEKSKKAKFPCDHCEYFARDKFNLRKHFESLHSTTPIKCPHDYCKVILPTKFDLKKHMPECYIHCPWDTCFGKFKRMIDFQSHQRAHAVYNRRLV